jgi:hypothetical protein
MLSTAPPPHAQQSAMLVGSVDFVDEHSHGWAIRARGGELAVQTFAGAAGASRLDAKYNGAPATVTTVEAPRYGLADPARIADVLDANADTETFADVTDRYGTPIHGQCVLTRAREDATALLALEPVAWYKGGQRNNSVGSGDLVGAFGRGGTSDDLAYLQSTSSTDALIASSVVVVTEGYVTIAMAILGGEASPPPWHGAVAAFTEHVRIDFVHGMLVLTSGDIAASYAFAPSPHAHAWTHIVAMFDAAPGVDPANNTKLYMNGTRVFPSSVDAGMGGPLVPSQGTLSIGRHGDRPSVPDIKLTEVLLFVNPAATAAAIYAHFQAVVYARRHTYDFRLASHIACTTTSDAFTHANVTSWLHGAAQHATSGVWLPGTVSWRFGPFLPRVAYEIDVVATGGHANVLAVARAARISLLADDVALPLDELAWAAMAAGPVGATTTLVVSAVDAARARMRLVVHLDDAHAGATRTNFTFAVRGSGERAYIPATALLHGIGRAHFDSANLVLPTTTPGVHLAVRAIGAELAPIPGQREAAVVVVDAAHRRAATPVIAAPPLDATSVRAGDKLRIRQPVSYAQSIGAGSSTILDFRNAVVPVGGEGIEGTAVRLRVSPVGASVAIPTTRIPAMAHPGGATRGRNGRYTLQPCDGRVVVTLGGIDVVASAVRFDVVVKAVRAGSAVAVDNADIELVESLWSVPAGTHRLGARVANMPDVTHIVVEVASAFEGVVLVDVAVNGYALMAPSEHVFASDVVFERECIVAASGAKVRAAALDVNGGTRIFDHAGNLHIDALDVNALRVLGALDATGVVRLGGGDDDGGGRRLEATATAAALRVDGNVHAHGRALRMGPAGANALTAATDGVVRLLDDGAHTVTAQASSWLHGRLVVEAGGVRMADALVFEGASARVLGGVVGASSAYVGLFSGVRVCHVADTWRGSRLLAAASIGLLARTTGLFHDAALIVELCDGPQSKAVYGIVVDALARGDPTPHIDTGVLCVRKAIDASAPARVALVTSGQAGCWVLDTNGDVHNGDLLQSALANGFAERQPSDDVGVCTIGKSTSASADWNGPQHPETPADARSAFIGVIVHCG